MSNNNHKQRSPRSNAAMTDFLGFITDAREMEEDELDEFLDMLSIDFSEFDARLSKHIERAKGKAELNQATENRTMFKSRLQTYACTLAMSLEEKRLEIEQRLGLLGEGQAATVFNRNYKEAEGDDLDGLLEALRALDERADAQDD